MSHEYSFKREILSHIFFKIHILHQFCNKSTSVSNSVYDNLKIFLFDKRTHTKNLLVSEEKKNLTHFLYRAFSRAEMVKGKNLSWVLTQP